jgi:hypothetical protein
MSIHMYIDCSQRKCFFTAMVSPTASTPWSLSILSSAGVSKLGPPIMVYTPSLSSSPIAEPCGGNQRPVLQTISSWELSRLSSSGRASRKLEIDWRTVLNGFCKIMHEIHAHGSKANKIHLFVIYIVQLKPSEQDYICNNYHILQYLRVIKVNWKCN